MWSLNFNFGRKQRSSSGTEINKNNQREENLVGQSDCEKSECILEKSWEHQFETNANNRKINETDCERYVAEIKLVHIVTLKYRTLIKFVLKTNCTIANRLSSIMVYGT